MVKIQAHLQTASHSKRRRTAFISVKWSLLTKTTVRDLLLRLEATKSTLNSALDAVTA